MSEQEKDATAEENGNAAEEEARSKKKAEAEKTRAEAQAALLERVRSGKLMLETPIRSASTDVKELHYDLTKLTGWEYAEAMDCDPKAANVYVITAKQALALFAKAARKANNGLDEIDIKERLGAVDALEAIQLTTLFFRISAQIKNRRSYSA